MTGLAQRLDRDGWVVVPEDPAVSRWAAEAYAAGLKIAADPVQQNQWLRHDGTWFVGVDAVPNAADGSINGMPLGGAWLRLITPPATWHRAQLSVTYAGYPRRGADDTDAAHRYRLVRASAHVDGLRLEDGRRFLREPHAFVAGFPLNRTGACPLMVWPGSHRIIGTALHAVLEGRKPAEVDLTDAYVAARKEALSACVPQKITASPGEVIVLHRHLVHGIAPHDPADAMPDEGRMIAYFRPECRRIEEWFRG